MSNNNSIDVFLLGEKGVGITSLCEIAKGNQFDPAPHRTKVFFENTMMVNNQSYKYRLWDHLGIQRKPPISNTNIKNAHIVLIIFAINNKKSFEEIDYWYNYIKDNVGKDGKGYIVALVGNKSDLYEDQEIPEEEIEKKSKELNVKYKITSAKIDAGSFKKYLGELFEEYINKYLYEEIKASSYKIGEKDKNGTKNKNKCNN